MGFSQSQLRSFGREHLHSIAMDKLSTHLVDVGQTTLHLTEAAHLVQAWCPKEVQQVMQGIETTANTLNSCGEALKSILLAGTIVVSVLRKISGSMTK